MTRISATGGLPAPVAVPMDGGTIASFLATSKALIAISYENQADGSVQATLFSGPLDGGEAATALAQATGLGGVASDGTNLYWQDEQGISSVPLTGGSAQVVTAIGAFGPYSATSEDFVWNSFILADYRNGTIESVPPDGGGAVTIVSRQSLGAVEHCGEDLCWVQGTSLMRMSAGGAPSS